MEEPEDLSDRGPVSCELVWVVPDASDVIDVPVSPSSVVTEPCDVSSGSLIWEFVEPQSFSFSRQRIWTTMQEEMRYDDSPAKAPPALKKKNGTAHTTAKFILIIWMGAAALRGGQPDVECA